MSLPTLHTHHRTQISPNDALQAFGQLTAKPVPLLVYTARRCFFLQALSNGSVHNESGQAFQGWNEIWEIRAFSPDHELRWRSDSDGTTSAVIVSEAHAYPFQDGWIHREQPILKTNSIQYILWGTKLDKGPTLEPNWTRLWEHQIGPLLVPVTGSLVQTQGRIAIQATEYFAEVDSDGNTACIEERLWGLNTYKEKN